MQSFYIDKNGNTIDYYSIFNISYDASPDAIKTAFRDLVKKYHPDTSETFTNSSTEKINLIIRGYKILSDESSRRDYDRHLFQHQNSEAGRMPIISKKRIKYSTSLSDLLKAKLRPHKMKRKDILDNFGQDIEISITQVESKRGAIAYIELPARMQCPLCRGEDTHCSLCRGIGRVHTTSQLEVKIPPHVDNSTTIDVDLSQLKPAPLTNFSIKNLRIKITVRDNRAIE